MSNLKLFVWTDVLSDFTEGIAFALANTEEEARTLIIDQKPGIEDDYNFRQNPKIHQFNPIAYALSGGS